MKKRFLCIFSIFTCFGFSQENEKLSFEFKETAIVQVADSNNIFFDYDSDGDLDLIISGYNKHISDVTSTHTFLYANDGKGNFTRDMRSTFMGIEYGKIDVGDIDNDNDLDVVIIGQELRRDREEGIVIYQNNGGVFKKLKKIKCNSRYASFININNDTYADLLIERDNTIEYYINDKKGDFKLQGELKGIEDAFEYGIVPFDIDNDGDDDVLIQGSLQFEVKPKTMVFKNDLGTYTSIPHNFQNTFQGAVIPVDIDADGDKDVFMTNLGTVSENLKQSYFYMNEKGDFKEKESNILTYNLAQVCFTDLDNDGDKDLVIIGNRVELDKPDYYTSALDVYINTGGKFELYKANAFPFLESSSLNAADVDGDGDQDILITGYEGEIPKTLLYINKLK